MTMATRQKERSKPDPFADLETVSKKITPRKLAGEKKRLWEEFIVRYLDGQYAGVSMAKLHAWCVEWLGLTCTLSCTRGYILEAAEAAEKNGS